MHEGEHGNQGEGWHDYLDLKKTLKAMGDTVRLNILHTLADTDEMTVTDLAQQLLVSQPLISWHLTMLRHAGLVRTRRKGRQVYCSLDRERCAAGIRRLAGVFGFQAALPPDASPPDTPADAAARPDGDGQLRGSVSSRQASG